MEYRLQDLIEIEKFQELQDRLNDMYPFNSSILDSKGNILTATAWQDICTKFHRKNKECVKRSVKYHTQEHACGPDRRWTTNSRTDRSKLKDRD